MTCRKRRDAIETGLQSLVRDEARGEPVDCPSDGRHEGGVSPAQALVWNVGTSGLAIRDRFEQCGLELHPTKTKIVYCKDDDRRGEHEHVAFDFLGFTFQPRRAKNRWGKYFVSFLPAISAKAAKSIRARIREWRMASTRNNRPIEDLARFVNPVAQGWMNFYGRFYRSKCIQVLRHINEALAAWARRKFKRFRRRERASVHWLGGIARREPALFAHWRFGATPAAEIGGAG